MHSILVHIQNRRDVTQAVRP